jgi:hypothetical protein
MWRSKHVLAGLVLVVLTGGRAPADRPGEPKAKADLVVTGVVQKVSSKRTAGGGYVYRNYVVSIRVKNVDKGKAAKPGRVIRARCYRCIKRPAQPTPNGTSYTSVPRKGQRVRAYLMRAPDGTLSGTYPDWFDVLDKAPVKPKRPSP